MVADLEIARGRNDRGVENVALNNQHSSGMVKKFAWDLTGDIKSDHVRIAHLLRKCRDV
jgi:hypothetical protein